MPWTARCDPPLPDTVTVVFSGAVSGAELREATTAAVALGREHRVTRYFVDATGVVHWPRETDFFFLPAALYDELGLDRRDVRAAIVVSASDDLRQIARFYETACLNRGWQVKIFETSDDAIAWLGVESSAV